MHWHAEDGHGRVGEALWCAGALGAAPAGDGAFLANCGRFCGVANVRVRVRVRAAQLHHPRPDARFMALPAPPTKDQFPVGATAIAIGRRFANFVGSRCSVVSVAESGTISVTLHAVPEPPAFAEAMVNSYQDRFEPSYMYVCECECECE